MYTQVFNGRESWSRNAMRNIMFMNYVMRDTNIALHLSLRGRAGSESDEKSLLSLPSLLESTHPTDITNSPSPPPSVPEFVFQRLNEIYIHSIRPENTTDTCYIGTIPVILNRMRSGPRAFLPLPSVLIKKKLAFFSIWVSLQSCQPYRFFL